jgi:hypothetical protein
VLNGIESGVKVRNLASQGLEWETGIISTEYTQIIRNEGMSINEISWPCEEAFHGSIVKFFMFSTTLKYLNCYPVTSQVT